MIYNFEFSHMGSIHFLTIFLTPPPRTKSDSYTAKLYMQRGTSLFIFNEQCSSICSLPQDINAAHFLKLLDIFITTDGFKRCSFNSVKKS